MAGALKVSIKSSKSEGTRVLWGIEAVASGRVVPADAPTATGSAMGSATPPRPLA